MIPTINFYSVERRTHYGVLKDSPTMTMQERIDVGFDVLKNDWVRNKIVVFSSHLTHAIDWEGNNNAYDYAASRGIKQLIVIGAYPSGAPAKPWVPASQLATYAGVINNILTVYPDIKEIVIDNEQSTETYHIGTMVEYVAMLAAAYSVAHPKNVKVYDGGIINGFALHIRTYQWVYNHYSPASATQYGNAIGMPPHQVRYALGIDTDVTFDYETAELDYLLSEGRQYVSGWNMHFYEEPTSAGQTTIAENGMRYQKEYLEQVGGRNVITNEMGVHHYQNPTLAFNMTKNFQRLQYRHAQLWDGTGTNAIPFTDDTTGAIFPNGIAYRDEVVLRKQ